MPRNWIKSSLGLLASSLDVAMLLEKLLAHGVHDILELKPVGVGVALDQGDMPDVEDVSLLLGLPWSLQRGTQQGLPIREHVFHLRPSCPDGHP